MFKWAMLLNLHVLYADTMSIDLCGTQSKNETLFCRKDSRQDAAEYEKHAIGVFKSKGQLVGHMPIELSNLTDYFLGNTDESSVSAIVDGQRKREVGLVVPANYSAFTKDLKTATFTTRTS